LATEALLVVKDQVRRQKIAALKDAAQAKVKRKSGVRTLRWVTAAFAIFIGVLIFADERTPSRPSGPAPSATQPTQQIAPASPPVEIARTNEEPRETDPYQMAVSGRPVGKTGTQLTVAEYKWCVFEDARLAEMDRITTSQGNPPSSVDIYNAYVDGFNAICADKMYQSSWENLTETQKTSNLLILRAEAAERLRSGLSLPADRPWPGVQLDPSNALNGVLVQGALKRKGYYKGRIDGIFGPNSRAALDAFLHDIDALPVMGAIEPYVVAKLFGE
jgi:hypothetical protein